MKVLLSLSATSSFAKGDRVAVKVGKDEWYLGVVRTAGAKLGIAFDDGSTATVSPEDFKDVKPVASSVKKIKKALTSIEAKALYVVTKPVTVSKAKGGPKAPPPHKPAQGKVVRDAHTERKIIVAPMAIPGVKNPPAKDMQGLEVFIAMAQRNSHTMVHTEWRPVASLDEASAECLDYIDEEGIGQSMWRGGLVRNSAKKLVALINYVGVVVNINDPVYAQFIKDYAKYAKQ